MRFVVYGEPVGKGRPRVLKSGHAYTPQKTRDYENEVAKAYSYTLYKLSLNGKYYEICITCYYSIPKSDTGKKRLQKLKGEVLPVKKPDLDNVLKAIVDGLFSLPGASDDARVVKMSAFKRYDDGHGPRVEVELYELLYEETDESGQPEYIRIAEDF